MARASLQAIAPLFCGRPGKLSIAAWHRSGDSPPGARRALMCDPVIAFVACLGKHGGSKTCSPNRYQGRQRMQVIWTNRSRGFRSFEVSMARERSHTIVALSDRPAALVHYCHRDACHCQSRVRTPSDQPPRRSPRSSLRTDRRSQRKSSPRSGCLCIDCRGKLAQGP